MAEVPLFQFRSISKFWKKSVKNDELAKKIEAFFIPNNFFSKHATLEFFLGEGVGPNDGHRFLLLSEDSVKCVHAELESVTSSTLLNVPTLHAGSYQNVEAIFIESPKAFLKITKDTDKHNKKVRTEARLCKMKFKWEQARSMFKENRYLFVAVDVESYERDHSCILEVGWSMFNSRTGLYMDRHFCTTEYRHLKNGKFVSDMKDRFSFGKTVWANSKTIANEIVNDLTEEKEKGNVVFVGHGVEMDLKYLENMGVSVSEVIQPVEIFDTAEMNAARVGKPHERINLGRLLDELDIENYSLHNAGNDAHYTLCLFLELCKLPFQPPEEISVSQPASSSE
ncbi:10826_t:CDS:2 [Funneliformis geosporum]|uniref:498_t:CDS:1 n=1 Tax=Funneliformis geosporum TaxID=1117311 RepID=A0A9W4WNP4_9GLOM|nr:10826_t:CDS:2 [Funneliformis geosporum]CAI2175120.1 498_t:CDS:2 [Funneliformis geosporum]